MPSPALDYVMLTRAYPPQVGGVERHVQMVHQSLGRRGLRGRVLALSPRPAGAEPADDVAWVDWSRLFGRVPASSRLKVTALLVPELLRLSPRTILHFQDWTVLFGAAPAVLAARPRNPRYLTIHGWDGRYPPGRKIRAATRAATALVRGTLGIGHFLAKWYPVQPAQITHGGVDPTRFAGAASPNVGRPVRAAYVGRLEPDTGVQAIAEAVRDLNVRAGGGGGGGAGSAGGGESAGTPAAGGGGAAGAPIVTLDLYGKGSLAPQIAALAETSGGTLRLHPAVQDPSTIMRDYPVIVASGYLTILEALCAKRLVLAYYGDPIREDILRLHPAAPAMFICGSKADVARSFETIAVDAAAALARSAAVWTWAATQTWDLLADQYCALWRIDGGGEGERSGLK